MLDAELRMPSSLLYLEIYAKSNFNILIDCMKKFFPAGNVFTGKMNGSASASIVLNAFRIVGFWDKRATVQYDYVYLANIHNKSAHI